METENKELDIVEVPIVCEDSTEELLAKYDGRSRRKADDVPAMQTVVCIMAVAVMFGLNILYPEIASEIFNKLNEVAFSGKELFPNPIDLISGLL